MPVIYGIKCTNCGKELDLSNVELDGDKDLTAEVGICEICLENAKEEARQKGYAQGRKDFET